MNINNTNTDGINLSKTNSEVIEQIDLTKKHQIPDENFVVINGKCANTNKLYLIKFKKSSEPSVMKGYNVRVFSIEGTYKIDEKSYKEFSDNKPSLKISSDELRGNPSCPCCENSIAMATCSCGGTHCISGVGENTCPWCGTTAFYGFSDEDFDINRTLG